MTEIIEFDHFIKETESSLLYVGNFDICLKDFVILKLLGEGAQAKVYLVKTDNDTLYAMKVIRKDIVLKTNSLQSIIQERKVLIEA